MTKSPSGHRLSVVMIVKNEAHNLKQSLPALQGLADELIVLDSGSTDQTKQVVEAHQGRFEVNTDWQGFGEQRRRAQSYATCDWILALDADEQLTEELITSIRSVVATSPANCVYGIRRIDCVFGHKIDNPYWPLKPHWRLYPHSFHYNKNLVHESVELKDASTKVLSGYMLHQTAPDPEFWLSKRLDYAWAWARDRAQGTKSSSVLSLLTHTLFAFIKQYAVDGRFLMGKYGLVYSLLFTQYTFNKYALLYDLRNNQCDAALKESFELHKHQQTPDLSNKRSSLSVVMIVKNEQQHLKACLQTVHDLADQIVILDSGSTDQTLEIAKEFGAQIHTNTDWKGFGEQRRLAQRYATGDYVLVLDADERLDQRSREAVAELLNQPLQTNAVFALARINYFSGVPTHARGWYRDWTTRMYAREHFEYTTHEVHESVDSGSAEVVKLAGLHLHYTSEDLHHYLVKRLRYSTDWSQDHAGKPISLAGALLRGWFSFVREYVIRGAFLHGTYGFISSVVLMWYTFNKYLLLWHANQNQH